MSAIPHIQEGMLWSDAISIINQVIDKINELDTALGGALVNGQFDYSALANKPSINSVELDGDLTQEDLSISIDSATQQSISDLSDSIDSIQETLGEKIDSNDLNTALQDYALSTDIPDISNLATKNELTTGLAGKVDNSTRTADLQAVNLALQGKAPVSGTPTTTEWNALLLAMDAKVTQAGNSATAADNSAQTAQAAASTVPSNCATRLAALELTVDGDAQHNGLTTRTTDLETKVGNQGDHVDVTTDLKETRVQSNDILEQLKLVPEVYEKVKGIQPLAVNY